MIAKEKFKAIYKSTYPKVMRLCLGYVEGDKNQAQEIAQDVFIKVWQNFDQFRNESSISTWIYRITVNTCLSSFRTKRKAPVQINNHLAQLSDDSEPASELKEWQLQQLYNCINKLNSDNKAIILLNLEGLPQKEIAEITVISHQAIRTRLHRIKESLSKCVKI